MSNSESIQESLNIIKKALEEEDTISNKLNNENENILILNNLVKDDGTIEIIDDNKLIKDDVKEILNENISKYFENNFDKWLDKNIPKYLDQYFKNKNK